MTKEIPATIHQPNEEPRAVTIIDNGEGFNPEEKGSIPNHDKVEIIYLESK